MRAAKPGTNWVGAIARGIFFAAMLMMSGSAYGKTTGTGPLLYKPPPPETTPHVDTLRQNVNLVTVNATVTDPYGRLVTGLDQENFRVYEDGREQQVMRFEEDDLPISIGTVFDVSGSMSDKIAKSRMAAVQFFKTANPADEFFLVDFSDRAEL